MSVNRGKQGPTLVSLLKPNPLLLLLITAVGLLFLSVFTFGSGSRFENLGLAEVLRTIAVGAIAASVTIVVDRNLTFRQFDGRIRATLLEAVGVRDSLVKLGVEAAHPDFDFGRIFREAKEGDTVRWLDTYCPRQNEFVTDLRAALERGVQVRMMVIEPGSDNACYRDRELTSTLTETGQAWEAGISAFLAKMTALADAGLGQLEVRLYKDLPCVPMYLLGREGEVPRKSYFSIYLVEATAHCTHLELSRGEWLENMAAYFDAKWERHSPTTAGAEETTSGSSG